MKRKHQQPKQKAQPAPAIKQPATETAPESKVVNMGDAPPNKEEPKPQPFEQGITEQKVTVQGNKLKIVALDPLGYYVAIDYVDIQSIKHISYNVIADELVLVLSETTGRIGETDVPLRNNMGKVTGAYRREVYGQITAYKTKLTERDQMSVFLSKWLGVDHITEDVFEGFKHNNIAKEVFEKAAKLKQEQADKKANKSGLVDTAGQPLK